MNSLINNAAFKKYVLIRLKYLRPHLDITRVSGSAATQFEIDLKMRIDAIIMSHPSKGKTFDPEL